MLHWGKVREHQRCEWILGTSLRITQICSKITFFQFSKWFSKYLIKIDPPLFSKWALWNWRVQNCLQTQVTLQSSSQVKRCLAQFTCVTCSLPVITGKFTCFEAASTSRRTHAHCLRAHVNLPEYHRYFTGSFTCGTHANLPATSMQNCLLLAGKNTCNLQAKTLESQVKIPANRRQKKPAIPRRIQNYQQLQAICHHTAGKFTCKLQVS